MSQTIQIKRNNSNKNTAPTSLLLGELAVNLLDRSLFSYDGTNVIKLYTGSDTYFDSNGFANNALKLGGQGIDYFGTATQINALNSSLKSTNDNLSAHIGNYNTHIADYSTFKTTTNNRLNTLESLGLSLVTENGETYLRSLYNFYSEGDISAGGIGTEVEPSTGTSVRYESAVNSGTLLGTIYIDGVANSILMPNTGFAEGLTIINGADLILKAVAGSTDTGDLVFRDGSDNEKMRIWYDFKEGNRCLIRFDEGKEQVIIHSGNIADYISSTGSSDTANALLRIDSRDQNPAPYSHDYKGKVTWHLKSSGHIGINNAYGGFMGMMQLSPWGDASGGAEHQLGFTGDGSRIFWRSGTSSWSSWREIIHSGNIGQYVSQFNVGGAYLPLSGGTLSNALTISFGRSNLAVADFVGLHITRSSIAENDDWSTYLMLSAYQNKGILIGGGGSGCSVYYHDGVSNSYLLGITKTGDVVATGDITAGSDARYKTIESYAEIDIETIANAPIINFKWTDRKDDRLHLGSTAQYWADTTLCNGVIPTNDDTLWTMGYGQIALASVVSVAKKVVNHEERLQIVEQELKDCRAENENLKKELEKWQKRN